MAHNIAKNAVERTSEALLAKVFPEIHFGDGAQDAAEHDAPATIATTAAKTGFRIPAL